ncbi:hypothetical protein V6N13_115676 [Hibiscus sabdariffa]
MWCFRTSMDPPPKIVNEGETVLKQVVSAGTYPVQIARGIEKTANTIVSELKLMSRLRIMNLHMLPLLVPEMIMQ